jgi:hypothetical protein
LMSACEPFVDLGNCSSLQGDSFMRHRLMWLVLEVAIPHGCS